MSFKKKQTVGHKYYVGFHLVPVQSPIDAITKISMGKKKIWDGSAIDTTISVSKPKLWGEEQGGVSGKIDILGGGDAQDITDTYLDRRLEDPTPSFLGVVSLVFNRFYIGNAPQLQPIEVTVKAVLDVYDNWRPHEAEMCAEYVGETTKIHIALDNSQPMYDEGYMDTAKSVLKNWLRRMRLSPADIQIVAFSEFVDASILKTSATPEDYDAMIAWVDAIPLPAPSADVVSTLLDTPNTVKFSNSNVYKTVGDATLPHFTAPSWSTPSYNALVLTSFTEPNFIGDGGGPNIGNNTAQVYIDVDVSALPTSTELSVSLKTTVLYYHLYGPATSFAVGVLNRVTINWYDAGGFLIDSDTDGAINSITLRNFTQSADFLKSVTGEKPATAVTARFFWSVSPSINNSGLIVTASQSNLYYSTPGTNAPCNWVEGVKDASNVLGLTSDTTTPGDQDLEEVDTQGALSVFQEGTDTSAAPQRTVLFISRGDPFPTSSAAAASASLASISGADVRTYQIVETDTTYSLLLDTDGTVPILSNTEDSMATIFGGVFLSYADINPIHLLRELIINPVFGGDGDTSVIGTSFATASTQIFSEGLGVSALILPSKREDIKREIEQHIDAVAFTDRRTGLWEVTLIRDDYDTDTLHTVDGTTVTDWGDVSRPLQDEIPSQITVRYTKRSDGSQASIMAHNTAAVQAVGIIPDTVDFFYFSCPRAAAKALDRELMARTIPLWSGSGTKVNYLPTSVNLGSPILVDLTLVGVNQIIVARITEIEEGDSKSETITIGWVEDKFSLLDDARITLGEDLSENTDPQIPPARFVEEAPYYYMVQQEGEAGVNTELDSDPDFGALIATPATPATGYHRSSIIAIQSGSTWVASGETDLCPYGVLVFDVDKQASSTTIYLTFNETLEDVVVGDLLQINDEILRVDALSSDGTTVTATVGRGCLDTVPAEHTAGAYALIWDRYVGTDGEAYTAGETLNVKLLPVTPTGVLALTSAATDTVTFVSRAYRPYPAANVKADGDYLSAGAWPGSVTLTWNYRDRTLQTTDTVEDFTDASIGPEAGVAYTIRLKAYDDAGVLLSAYQDTVLGTVDTYALTSLGSPPAGTVTVGVSVIAVRGAYESLQAYEFNYAYEDARLTESYPAEVRVTEDGDNRITED